MSVANSAIHLKRKYLPGSEMLQYVENNAWQDAASRYLDFINVVSNIQCLSPNEIFQDDEYAKLRRKPSIMH